MKMDLITDTSYKASTLSDPGIVALPDLSEEDNGQSVISVEIDNIMRAVKNDEGFAADGGNAYDNTIRTGGRKGGVTFSSKDLNNSKVSIRESQKTNLLITPPFLTSLT